MLFVFTLNSTSNSKLWWIIKMFLSCNGLLMQKAVAWLLVQIIACLYDCSQCVSIFCSHWIKEHSSLTFHHTALHLVVFIAQPVISPLCNRVWGGIVLAGGLKVHLSWVLSCRWLFFPVSLSWRLLACTPDEKRTDNSVRSQPHKMRQVCVTWIRERLSDTTAI